MHPNPRPTPSPVAPKTGLARRRGSVNSLGGVPGRYAIVCRTRTRPGRILTTGLGAGPGRWAVLVIAPVLTAVMLVASGSVAVAAASPAMSPGAVEMVAASTQVLALVNSVDELLVNLRNWLIGILAGLATLFLTIGAVRYVMANGDPGEIEKAKLAFRAAAVGYCLALLAPLVVTVLRGIVGA